MKVYDFALLDLEEISEWPLNSQLLSLFLLFICVQAIAFWLYLYPKSQQLSDIKQQQFQLEAQIGFAEKKAAILPDLQIKLVSRQQQLAALSQQLISQKELAAIPASLTRLGLSNQLTFHRVEWGEPEDGPELVRFPLNIELTGEYHQIGRFSQAIAGLSKLIRLYDVTLHRSSPGSQRIRMVAKAYLYQFKSEELRKGTSQMVINKTGSVTFSQAHPYTGTGRKTPFGSAAIFTLEDEIIEESGFVCNQAPAEVVPAVFDEYPLSRLKVKGVMGRDGVLSALVEAPDGHLEIVNEKQAVGNSYALVSRITPDYLLSIELIPDGNSCWHKREVKLSVQ